MSSLGPLDAVGSYAAILDALPIVAYMADAAGEITYFSSGWERFTGNAAADVLAQGYPSILHPDDVTAAIANWTAAQAAGIGYRDERRIRFGDGTYRWVFSQADPVRDSSGEIVAWFGTVTDVQHERDSEKSARERAEFVERLLAASDDCIKVLDLTGRLVSISGNGETMLAALGLPTAAGTNWLSLWQGDSETAAAACFQAALADGIGRFTGTFTADGRETWWDVTITPILDANGAPENVLAVSRDITESVIAERAVARGRERMRLLSEAHPGVTWTARPDGRLDSIAGSDSIGRLPVGEQLGNAWFSIIHPDERDAVIARWRESLLSGSPFDVEFRARMRDGGYRWVLSRALAHRDAAGDIIGWVGVGMDISRQKRAYERERRIAVTFQAAALTNVLPTIEHLRLSADYRPGSSELTIGGDWYDAFTLNDGRVVLTIGDVVGNGLNAAVAMAKLRQAMRSAAFLVPTPQAMLDVADATVREHSGDMFATAMAGVFDAKRYEFTFASAGHPGPALRGADGSIEDFVSPGLLLGLREPGDAHTVIIPVPPGSTLVFYTDGLTEATRDADEGQRRLHAAIGDASVAAADNPAKALIDSVLRGNPATDDIAVLVAEVGPRAR